jgi:mRNA-degrading endonuclease RelE of RelBE toxin-antitoxin system
MWAVQWHPEAEEELMQLPRDEQLAVGKLAAIGPALP